MKLLISVAIWGEDYRELFVDYSLASLLSRNNIPKTASDHRITFHIVTSKEDAAWLKAQPALRKLSAHCDVAYDLFEDHGYHPLLVPTGPEGEKYCFLSLLQNIAIDKSLAYDAVVFNYADFIWADGSLSHSIAMLSGDVDAVLSFCLPVDKDTGVAALDDIRQQGRGEPGVLDLPARTGADIAIRCLHREAKLRYWDDPAFTVTPTYLLWPVGEEGVIVRAYHQTILALKVKADDPTYRAGIPGGSLDGYLTAILAERANIHHVVSSDDALVFSLYDTIVESQIGGPSRQDWTDFDREASMRECLQGVVSPGQREFALEAIEVRRGYEQPKRWRRVARQSREILEALHKKTKFDPDAYDRNHAIGVSLLDIARRWRETSANSADLRRLQLEGLPRFRRVAYQLAERAYRQVMASALASRFKTMLGPRNARRLRLAYQRLLDAASRSEPVEATGLMPGAEETKSLILAGQTEEVLQRILPFLTGAELAPDVVIGRRSAACMWVGGMSEAIVTDLDDPADVETLLTETEGLLREVVQDVPLWNDAHRILGRNLWFQGRVGEALACFRDAEDILPKLAEITGLDLLKALYLPRNCVTVIGLLGHLDGFVKHKVLIGDDRTYRLVAPESEVVNHCFLNYWKDYVEVELSSQKEVPPSQIEAACTVNWNWAMPQNGGELVHVHRALARIQRRWAREKRASLLNLAPAHAKLLEQCKERWGMAPDDWFVCLHVRSAGFYTEREKTAQHFRNTPIEDYYPMMRAIVEQGGWVVRMGDEAMPALEPVRLGGASERVIDYAHRPEKSAELDVALCASCRLFVSSPSGLHTVAHAFGRPACYINYPIYAGFPWHPGEIFAPQLYFSRQLERVLTLDEILSSKLVHADQNFLLARAGVELVNNTPDEICETVREALDPKAYVAEAPADGIRVRDEFERLNQAYAVDISGHLGLYFAAKNAQKLYPEGERQVAPVEL